MDPISHRAAASARRLEGFLPAAYAFAYVAVTGFFARRVAPVGDLGLDTDFYGEMVIAAQRLAEGAFSVENYPYKGPLYSFVLLAFEPLTGDWFRAALALNAVAAGAALVLCHRLVLGLFGRAAALVAMLALSLVPDFFSQAHHANTDILFLALALGATALFCREHDGTRAALAWSRGAAGVLAGLAFLTRYNGFALLPAALAADLIVAPLAPPVRSRLRSAAWFVAGFLLVATPWFAANLRETGRLLPAKNVQNVMAGLFAGSRWEHEQIEDAGDLRDAAIESPRHTVVQYASNLGAHARGDLDQLLGWPLALVALASFVAPWFRPPAPAVRRYLCFPICHFLAIGAVFYAPRFSFFLVPAYMAMGFEFLRHGPTRPAPLTAWRRRIALASLLAAGLALQVARIRTQERTLAADQPLELLRAAPALRAHAATDSDAVLMARKGHLAYLAGLRYQPFPRPGRVRTLEGLLEFAREHHVRYLNFGQIEFHLVPELRFLAAVDSLPGLEVVYGTPTHRVFEIRETLAPSGEQQLAILRANVRLAGRDRPDQQARALGDLAEYHEGRQEWRLAEDIYRTIIDISERSTIHRDATLRNAALSRIHLARTLLEQGGAREGVGHAEAALAYLERHGPSAFAARAARIAGRCHRALGDATQAEARFARARALDPSLQVP